MRDLLRIYGSEYSDRSSIYYYDQGQFRYFFLVTATFDSSVGVSAGAGARRKKTGGEAHYPQRNTE